jgi:glutathione S-transferase/GST-like protein
MLELYHWEPNTFFLKPLIALKEKQAEFTSRYFDPTKLEQFAPSFPENVESRLHLEREGPVLVDGKQAISSSYFMLEYIAEAVAGPVLNPGGAWEHYQSRAWGQFLGLSLGSGVSALGCARYLAPMLRERDQKELRAKVAQIEPQERRAAWLAVIDGAYDEKALTGIRHRLEFPLKRLETALSRDRWLAGRDYSIADIDAFAMLHVLPDLAADMVNERATPRITDFLHRMRERSAVREALAMSRTGKPQQAFVPGAEPSRWG